MFEGITFVLLLYNNYFKNESITKIGSGALPNKMLLVRIIEDNKIYAYFIGQVWLRNG